MCSGKHRALEVCTASLQLTYGGWSKPSYLVGSFCLTDCEGTFLLRFRLLQCKDHSSLPLPNPSKDCLDLFYPTRKSETMWNQIGSVLTRKERGLFLAPEERCCMSFWKWVEWSSKKVELGKLCCQRQVHNQASVHMGIFLGRATPLVRLRSLLSKRLGGP